MKKILLLAGFFMASATYGQTAQSISLPKLAPIHCDGRVAGSCTYPHVYANTTGIMMAPATASGAGTTGVTDSLGNTWHLAACAPSDGGDCFWYVNFGSSIPWYGAKDTITIAPNYYNTQGYDSFLFLYDGTWAFTGKWAQASYGDPTPPSGSGFSFCTTGNSCPFSWTGMVYVEAGEMIIGVSLSRETGMVPKAGLGYSIEANDGYFAIEDMIAPVEGIYIGSLVWTNPDGINPSSGHWQMGIAVFAKTN